MSSTHTKKKKNRLVSSVLLASSSHSAAASTQPLTGLAGARNLTPSLSGISARQTANPLLSVKPILANVGAPTASRLLSAQSLRSNLLGAPRVSESLHSAAPQQQHPSPSLLMTSASTNSKPSHSAVALKGSLQNSLLKGMGSSLNTKSSLVSPNLTSSALSHGSQNAKSKEQDSAMVASVCTVNNISIYAEDSSVLPSDVTDFVDFTKNASSSTAVDPTEAIKHQFLNAIAASLIGGPDFYSPRDPVRVALLQLAEAITRVDGEFVLKVALYARQELNIRTTSNLLIAFAASRPESRSYLRKYIHKCINLPSDWIEVAQLAQTFNDGSLHHGSLPAALRKAMVKKFMDFDEYQLAKYNKEKPASAKGKGEKSQGDHGDAAGSDDEEELERLSFSLKQLIRKLHITEPVQYVMGLLGKRYPANADEFYVSRLPGVFEADRAGKRMKLQTPETWETQVSMKGNNAQTWQTLMDHRKLPFMAMLRNLRNIILAEVAPKYHDNIISRLGNETTIVNSKQFPFRFFSAYEVLGKVAENPDTQKVVQKGSRRGRQSVRVAKPPPPELIAKYCKALDEAVRISTCFNVSPIRGHTVILCNVGDAMRTPCTSAKGLGKPRMVREIAVLLGLMCLHACESCDLFAFSELMDLLAVDVLEGTILENMEVVFKQVAVAECRLCARCGCERDPSKSWSMACSCPQCERGCDVTLPEPAKAGFPLHYLAELVAKRIEVDNLVVLSNVTDLPSGVEELITKYRHFVNPNLLFVNVDLSGVRPDVKCSPHRHPSNVDIAGYSDAILRFIADRGEGVGLVTYVSNIDQAYTLSAAEPAAKPSFSTAPKRSASTQLSRSTSHQPPTPSDPAVKRDFLFPGLVNKMWRCARVFISSTFRDMHGERDLLTRFVFPELRARARPFHINIFEVDLRWGLTEEDTRSNRTLEICLREIAKSNFFIGLLGTRYGYIPPAYVVPDELDFDWLKTYPAGRSVTELEMHCAALHDPAASRERCLFMLRETSFVDSVPKENVSDFQSENADCAAKVAALRARIHDSELPAFTYSASWGGVVDGRPMAAGLDNFSSVVLESMWTTILSNHQRLAHTAGAGELSEHDTFAEDLAETFVGRAALCHELLSIPDNAASGLLIVSGRAGVGKTSLMAHFVQQYGEKHGSHSLVTHFVGPIPFSNDIRKTLLRLCHALTERLGVDDSGEAWKIPEDYGELRELFPVVLAAAARASPTNKLVVVVDGVDQLSDANSALTFNWLPAVVPEGVFFYIGTREGPLEQLLTARPQAKHMAVAPLSIMDKGAVVRSLLGKYRKHLDESSFNNQLSMLIGKRDATLPLFLAVACEELRVNATFEGLSETLRSMSSDVAGLFDQSLQRLEKEHTAEVMAVVFRLFACVRFGVREQDFLALLCRAAVVSASPVLAARVFRSLEPFLVCSGSNRAMLLFHAELVKAVEIRYLGGGARDVVAIHDLLASHYLKLADPRGDWSFVGRDRIALSELPYHLCHAGRVDDLEYVLCNFSYIQAACAAGLGFDLLAAYIPPHALRCTRSRDIIKTMKVGSVYEYGRFVSRNVHIIALKPSLVLQQALNEPEQSAPARAAALQVAKNPAPTPAHKKNAKPALKALAASRPLVLWGNKPDMHDPCVRTTSGLLHPVLCVAVSADGALTACGLRSGAVHMYESETGRELWTLQAHASTVTDVCFAGSESICSASADSTAAVWSAATGQRLQHFKEHNRKVNGLAVLADGSCLFTASWDATVRMFDLRHGTALGCLRETRRPVNCIAVHPRDPVVLFGDWGGMIFMVDTSTKKLITTLKGHTKSVRSVAFSPAGRHIVSSAMDSTVRLWSATSFAELGLFDGHSATVNKCLFSPNGLEIVTVSDDCKINVWAGNLGTSIASVQGTSQGSVTSLAVDSEDDLLAVGHHESAVRILNASTLSQVAVVHGDGSAITALKWAVNDWNRKPTLMRGHDNGVMACVWDRDAIYTASRDCTIRVWGAERRTLEDTVHAAHADWVNALALAPAEPLLASAGNDFIVKLWKIRDGEVRVAPECIRSLAGHAAAVVSLSFLGNGLLASGSSDATCKVWNASSGQGTEVTTLHARGHRVRAVVAMHETVVFGSDDGSVDVLDPLRGNQIASFTGHNSRVLSAAFNKQQLVTAGADGALKFWDTSLPSPPTAHVAPVSAVEISADGLFAISGDRSGCVIVWHLAPASSAATLHRRFFPHAGAISGIQFVRQSNAFVTASFDTVVKLFNMDELPHEQCMTTLEAPLTCAAYSSATDTVIAGGWDGYVAVLNSYNLNVLQTLSWRDPQRDWISSIACNGATVTAVALDGLTHEWSLSNRSSGLQCLRASDATNGQYGGVYPMPFLTAAAYADGHLLDASSNGSLFGGECHVSAPVNKLAVSDSLGKPVLVAACADGSLRFWRQNASPSSAQERFTRLGEFVCRAACEAVTVRGTRVFAGDNLGNIYSLTTRNFE